MSSEEMARVRRSEVEVEKMLIFYKAMFLLKAGSSPTFRSTTHLSSVGVGADCLASYPPPRLSRDVIFMEALQAEELGNLVQCEYHRGNKCRQLRSRNLCICMNG